MGEGIKTGKPVVNVKALFESARKNAEAGVYPKTGFAAYNNPIKDIPPELIPPEVQAAIKQIEEEEKPKEVDNTTTPVVIMMIGFPGSGKTTIANTIASMHAEDRTLKYASTDMLIEAYAAEHGITYAEAFPLYYEEAEKIFKRTINQAIDLKYDVLIDRTNVSKRGRAKLLRRFIEKGYTCIAVNVFTTPEQLIQRNEERLKSGRGVGMNVIQDFVNRYEQPETSEGFDVILQEMT